MTRDIIGGGGSSQAGAGRDMDCWRLRVRERTYTSAEAGVDFFRDTVLGAPVTAGKSGGPLRL